MKLELLYLFCSAQIGLSCVFVQMSDGIIRGRLAKIPNTDQTFYAFQEIPYARPPIGKLRFQPPQPVTKWFGILNTLQNTKTCYQIGLNLTEESEDCLYLNVYTPTLEYQSLPVMVYIHGGGFILSDGTYKSYGPEYLVQNDVVVVTLNYRLGVFGFLSTGDDVVPGNNGLKDQLFALQWVQNNIHLFGGSPKGITIFGQSAGAASVGYHLLSPKSQGMFQRAIMESGSPISAFAYQRNAKHYAYKIASYFDQNITENSSSQLLLTALLQAPADDIDKYSEQIVAGESYDTAQLFQGFYFAPVIEPQSQDAFLTEKMYETIIEGRASRVPIMMGINSEESLSQATDLDMVKRIMGAFDINLQALVPNDMNTETVDLRTKAGASVRQLYVKNDLFQNHVSAGIKYMSDSMVSRSVLTHAFLQSRYSDVYFYQFSYDGKLGNVSIVVEGTDRVGHNEEIAYLWRVRSELFDNYNVSSFQKSDIVTRNRLLVLWTNFAKTGNPTPSRSELLQNVEWLPVVFNTTFYYLNINNSLAIERDPKKDTFWGWQEIYKTYGKPPYDTY